MIQIESAKQIVLSVINWMQSKPKMSSLADQLNESLMLTLAEPYLEEAPVDQQSFVSCVEILTLLPSCTIAATKLLKVLMATQLEPYFTWQEKSQLMLTIISRADPLGKSVELRTFALQISASLDENRPTLMMMVEDECPIRFLSSEYLIQKHGESYRSLFAQSPFTHFAIQKAFSKLVFRSCESVIANSCGVAQGEKLQGYQAELLQRLADVVEFIRLMPNNLADFHIFRPKCKLLMALNATVNEIEVVEENTVTQLLGSILKVLGKKPEPDMSRPLTSLMIDCCDSQVTFVESLQRTVDYLRISPRDSFMPGKLNHKLIMALIKHMPQLHDINTQDAPVSLLNSICDRLNNMILQAADLQARV